MAHVNPKSAGTPSSGRVSSGSGMNRYAGTTSQSEEWGSEFVEWYNQARERLTAAGLGDQMPNLEDYQYNPNLWQQLMGAFGDTSSKTNFYNQSRANIREDINALLATIENREFNSPAAQAGRLQAAGINPTLNGDSIDNGNTEIPQDATPDEVPAQETVSPGEVGSVVSTLMSFGSSAIGILKGGIEITNGIEQLVHNKSMNSISEVKELLSSIPGMTQFLTGLTPSADWVDPVTNETIKAGTPIPAASVGAYIDSFGMRPGASKLAKQLAGKIRYDKNGNPTTGYQASLNELQAQSLENAKKIVEGMSTPGYTENISAWAANYNKMYGDLIQEQSRIQLEEAITLAKYRTKLFGDERSEADLNAALAGAEAEQAEAEFNEEYYNKLSPSASASAENQAKYAAYEASVKARTLSRIESAMEKHFERAIQDILDRNLPEAQEKHLLAGIYEERNKFYAELAAQKQELVTKASKVIGDTDILDAGAQGLKGLTDLLGNLGGLKKPGKQPARPSQRYTH